MKRRFVFLFLLAFSLKLQAEPNLKDYSDSIEPMLEQVEVFYQDSYFRYRILLYRVGFEHITAYTVIQKYSFNEPNDPSPYTLVSSVSFDGLNQEYNYSIESITKDEDGFLIVLDAIHSYLYENTKIVILLHENLEYEILSGLVSI